MSTPPRDGLVEHDNARRLRDLIHRRQGELSVPEKALLEQAAHDLDTMNTLLRQREKRHADPP